MIEVTISVRPEQARAVKDVLAALEIARERADHLCAGVIVGLVPDGSGVLAADVETSELRVALPLPHPEDADAPTP